MARRREEALSAILLEPRASKRLRELVLDTPSAAAVAVAAASISHDAVGSADGNDEAAAQAWLALSRSVALGDLVYRTDPFLSTRGWPFGLGVEERKVVPN